MYEKTDIIVEPHKLFQQLNDTLWWDIEQNRRISVLNKVSETLFVDEVPWKGRGVDECSWIPSHFFWLLLYNQLYPYAVYSFLSSFPQLESGCGLPIMNLNLSFLEAAYAKNFPYLPAFSWQASVTDMS